MQTLINEYKDNMLIMINKLPDNKIIELFDYMKFLLQQYPYERKTLTDEDSLLMQQKSLNKIWNNKEEDLYEL
jgi:hypothetical protein